MFIALLVKVQALPSEWKQYGVENVTEGLQNFIICVEMLLFALAHYFVFSHKPFVDPAAAQAPCIASCLKMLDVRDVADDVKEHFVDPLPRPKLPTITRRSRSKRGDEETTPLVNEGNPAAYNSDTEHIPWKLVPNAGVDVSSDFGILSYRDLDPRPSQGRMSSVPSGDSSGTSSSDGSSQQNIVGDNNNSTLVT